MYFPYRLNYFFLPLPHTQLLLYIIALITGIISAKHTTTVSNASCLTFSIYIGLIFCCISLVIVHIKKSNRLLLLILSSVMFFLLGAYTYRAKINDMNIFYNEFANKKCFIKAYVQQIEPWTHRYKKKITLQMAAIKEANKGKLWVKKSGIIILMINTGERIRVGDYIFLSDVLIQKPTTESYGNYCIKEGIKQTVFWSKKKDPYILYSPRFSLARLINKRKIELKEAFEKKFNKKTAILLMALFLGNKTNDKILLSQMGNDFQTWGIIHYLARSGLHLVILSTIWLKFASLMPIRFGVKSILIIIMTVFYNLLTWQSISFLRALLMLLYQCICLFFALRYSSLYALSLITIGVILNNPMHIFFLDFQLSFGLTYGLLWFNELSISDKNNKTVKS